MRFGRNWSLSPEQSLCLHGGNWTVPRQLVVRSSKSKNNLTKLPHGTSLLDLRAALPKPAEPEVVAEGPEKVPEPPAKPAVRSVRAEEEQPHFGKGA